MQKKKLISLYHNYKPPITDGQTVYGEEADYYKVGVNGVILIDEHLPMGNGDRLWYDVHYEDGHVLRLFNPNCARWENE